MEISDNVIIVINVTVNYLSEVEVKLEFVRQSFFLFGVVMFNNLPVNINLIFISTNLDPELAALRRLLLLPHQENA